MYRFTETDKWKDNWFMDLSPGQKLVWLYILDNCDNAGFIEINIRYISFVVGIEEHKISGAIKGLHRGLIGPKNNVYFVKKFLVHQKNLPLNHANNAHKQIIRILESYKKDFPQVYKSHVASNKGLISPPGIVKVKVDVFKEPTLEEVQSYCDKQINYNIDAERIYKGYNDAGWKDSHGKQIKNWKQKIIHVWCKDENKKQAEDLFKETEIQKLKASGHSSAVAEQLMK